MVGANALAVLPAHVHLYTRMEAKKEKQRRRDPPPAPHPIHWMPISIRGPNGLSWQDFKEKFRAQP